MHTAHSLPYGGSLSGGLSDKDPPDRDHPGQRHPGQRHLLDRDPLDRDPLDRDPWKEHGTKDRDPPEGPGCQTGSNIIPPVNRMTHMSKNITLPQTSFVGGYNPNKIFLVKSCYHVSQETYPKISQITFT